MGKSGGYNRGGGRRTQGQDFRRKMNPVGSDGQTCGSYRHLMAECPDSWENMRRVNVVEKENVVFLTGYNKQEIQQLGVDARNCAVKKTEVKLVQVNDSAKIFGKEVALNLT